MESTHAAPPESPTSSYQTSYPTALSVSWNGRHHSLSWWLWLMKTLVAIIHSLAARWPLFLVLFGQEKPLGVFGAAAVLFASIREDWVWTPRWRAAIADR